VPPPTKGFRATEGRLCRLTRRYAFGTSGAGAILYSVDQGGSWRAIKTDLRAVRQICIAAV
jgi:hypothetical protein